VKREHQEILDEITAATDALRNAVEAVPADLLDKRPEPEEWSVLETLVHVRDVVMLAYGFRIRTLLFQEDPTVPTYSDESNLLAASRQNLSAADLVDMIEVEHRQTVRVLSHLADEAWEREGHHPEFGTMSLKFLANRIALHAADHTQQIIDAHKALS
jgi:hypothetical protein